MRAMLMNQGLDETLSVDTTSEIEPRFRAENERLDKKAHGQLILILGDEVLRQVAMRLLHQVIGKVEYFYMTKALANRLYKKHI